MQVILSIPKNRAIKIEKTTSCPVFEQNWQPGPRAALAIQNGIEDAHVLLVRLSKWWFHLVFVAPVAIAASRQIVLFLPCL